LAKEYLEWGWHAEGKNHFPPNLYTRDTPSTSFIKHAAAKIISTLTLDKLPPIDKQFQTEVEKLKQISPHAIITTNYDNMLELLFPSYTAIIGEKILRASYASIGEIFKIHGCISDPNTLVLTESDYEDFIEKRKYLSAKLLTYFAEHPLLLVDYSASDPNIAHILSDIDRILATEGELIPNIYLLEWRANITSLSSLQREHVVDVGHGRSVRIKAVYSDEFSWVFDAFRATESISKINVKLLRSLLARTCEVIRHDIPMRTMEVDYQTLERVVDSADGLISVLGIQTCANASLINADFPYTLTDVARLLGYERWHKAHQLLKCINDERGVNIQASDNSYHVAVKSGAASFTHKYSTLCVELLRKVKDKMSYELINMPVSQ